MDLNLWNAECGDDPVPCETEKMRNLLALAEAATACGREAYAAYLLYCAERLALETGDFSLISLVWRQSCLSRPPKALL